LEIVACSAAFVATLPAAYGQWHQLADQSCHAYYQGVAKSPSKKIVNVPDFGKVEYPGDMADEEVAASIRHDFKCLLPTTPGYSRQPSNWDWAKCYLLPCASALLVWISISAIGWVISGFQQGAPTSYGINRPSARARLR
jgi:hypothetical protein